MKMATPIINGNESATVRPVRHVRLYHLDKPIVPGTSLTYELYE